MAVQGSAASKFAEVRAVFEQNFTEYGDVGAAVAVLLDGEPVVDLYGGQATETTPWTADTLVNVYSTTKGLTALCAHLLVERGELKLDKPVAYYWPEFAANGKAGIPVHMLLSHRAGLLAPAQPMAPGEVFDWDKVCSALAATPPWWEPGTAAGYHGVTFGFLVGELVRRISGMSLGTFLRTNISEPLGADAFIGTPESEYHRCADLIGQVNPEFLSQAFPGAPKPPITSLTEHPFAPVIAALGYLPGGDVNSAEWRSAEVPAANGHASAKGLATIYGAIATNKIVNEHTVENMRTPQGKPGESDMVIGTLLPPGTPFTWGLGYMLNTGGNAGPNPGAFGHAGAGGSFAFADPENRLSFAYVMNKFAGGTTGGDPRSVNLVNAVYRAVG